VESGGCVRGIRVPGGAETYSRSDVDDLEEVVGVHGAKGLAWAKVDGDGWSGPIASFFEADEIDAVDGAMAAEPGDLLLFVADDLEVAAPSLGHLREHLADDLGLADDDEFEPVWITDMPLVEWDDGEERWVSMHHPFTHPLPEDISDLEDDPGSVRARAYDLVINGHEIAGGSIRIHRRDLQWRIFDLLEISEEEAREKFGFLLDAFQYGPPPHGGIAYGMDRMVMLMTGMDSLRDVIAFPKTHRAADPLCKAPSAVRDEQLAELGLKLDRDDD
ncbi:MAG: amino acid--tRNA ligase-related protein, partial [Bradymonadaceae bacterium]